MQLVDLHCHILPNVDDGSPDPDTSLLMAQIAADSKISAIVATPHCNISRTTPNYRSPELLERLQDLNRSLKEARVPVEILPGAEVLGRWNIGELLRTDKLQTLNNSRYLLVEFDFGMSGADMCEILEIAAANKVVPVVAHPERYDAVQADPALAVFWFRQGYVLQLNKGSIIGKLGRGAYATSRWLVRHGFAHVIATDAHHSEYRTPSMTRLYDELASICPPSYYELLLETNPARIIQDQLIPPPDDDFLI